MQILCAFLGHRPGPDELWNRGYYFSCCPRCGRDVIRSDDAWEPVPRGHRVVWKAGRHHEHSIPADYSRTLPILYRDSSPRPQQALGPWRPRLMFLGGSGGGSRRSGVAADSEVEDQPYPWLIAAALIAAATLQALMSWSQGRALD